MQPTIALVTTTIHTPRALELFRKYDPDALFIIAGDLKTPDEDLREFSTQLKNCIYLSADAQKKFNYRCSEFIGWNCVQRRNIAVLEALRFGADLIVSWDTDNLPLSGSYFTDFESTFNHWNEGGWCGLEARSSSGWLNPYGNVTTHRGFPINVESSYELSTVVDAKVGVAAGLCLGDPDIDAITRIVRRPNIDAVSEAHRSGFVVSLDTHTVFNTQNTCYRAEFAPAMFCAPGIGRFDDIIASLLTQRVMRDHSYHVHVGKPFAWQERNKHDLIEDLEAEIWGMRHILEISDFIDTMPTLPSVEDAVHYYYARNMALPSEAREAGLAWCEDIAQVLKDSERRVA